VFRVVTVFPRQANTTAPDYPHEERPLQDLKMDNDAIERRAPAAEIVQGPKNRHVEPGQEIRHC
jgi:hypothetical protein